MIICGRNHFISSLNNLIILFRVLANNCPNLETLNLKNCAKLTNTYEQKSIIIFLGKFHFFRTLLYLSERCPQIKCINIDSCKEIDDKGIRTLR